MENTEFDRIKVIQDMQELKMKKLEEMKANLISSEEITIDEESLSQTITVKYLGKIELVNELGERLERDWYAVIEQVNGEFQITYYDENQQFLGIQKVINEVYGEIIPSKSMMWERPDEMTSITEEDIQEAKTQEDLEQEQKEEEAKVSADLAKNMDEPELKLKTYRGIVDPVFMRELPETCQGAKKIGMATLEDGRYVLVADYGNGFEIAKGTEPARPTIDEVNNEDRTTETVTTKSLHAIMKVSGNGKAQGTKEIGIEIGPYGYPETKLIDRAHDNTRRARDVVDEREGIGGKEQKSEEEQREDARAGENVADIHKMINDFVENDTRTLIIDQMIKNILESCQDVLDDLYRKDEQEAAVIRTIKNTVRNRGNITLEEIERSVAYELEYDRDTFSRQGFDPRRG